MKSEQDIKERLDILGELYRRHEIKEIALALRQLYWVLEIEWPQRTSAKIERVEKSCYKKNLY